MCDSPFIAIKRGEYVKGKVYNHDVKVPCGKCPVCLRRRVNDWVFRLTQEEKEHQTAFFITLTYDNWHIPISKNNFMTLKKADLQKFWKRLRKRNINKIKYYACGEYGGKTKRPHYHAIAFGIDSIDFIFDSWTLGRVHVGNVTNKSIAYCCKYIDKGKTVPMHARDDRIKEFSVQSQNLGINYLTKSIKNYYGKDYKRYHVIRDGYKHPLPRYYRKQLTKLGIYSEEIKRLQTDWIQKTVANNDSIAEQSFNSLHWNDPEDYQTYKSKRRIARALKHNRDLKNRDKI